MAGKLTIIATALGVITSSIALIASGWKAYDYLYGGTPEFRDYISVSYPSIENERFMSFLKKYDGETVFLNSVVDLSVAMPDQQAIMRDCNQAYPEENDPFGDNFPDNTLIDGYVYNRRIILPVDENYNNEYCYPKVAFNIAEPDTNKVALRSGGTGVLHFRLRGFFNVQLEAEITAEQTYVLHEVPASLNDYLSSR